MAVSAAAGADRRKQLQPQRLRPGAGHLRRQFGVVDQGFASGRQIALPHLPDEIERRSQRGKQRSRRRVGRFSLGGSLALFAEVEVVARRLGRLHALPGALAHRAISQPRRNHQRFLRSADDDVDAPAIHIEVGGAQAGDGVHHQQGVVALGADQFRNPFTSCRAPVELSVACT